MRLSSLCFVCSVVGLNLLFQSVRAQTTFVPALGPRTSAIATFTMPQSADPTALTFTDTNVLYTNADSNPNFPGDNAGTALTGQLLATNGSSPGGGLELHGKLGYPGPKPYPQVLEFDVFTTYTDGLALNSVVPPSFTGIFIPWYVARIDPIAGYAQGFRLTGDLPTQAPMTEGGYFGLLSVSLADPFSDPTNFYASRFAIEAVPEPGIYALLAGLTVGGGLLQRRRSKHVGKQNNRYT